MNITIESREFMRLLSKVQGIPGKSGSLPILGNLLLEADGDEIEATATDLEVSKRVKTKAEIFDPGSIALCADTLTGIVKRVPEGVISGEVDDGKVILSCGRARFSLPHLPADDFPAVERVEGEELVISTK